MVVLKKKLGRNELQTNQLNFTFWENSETINESTHKKWHSGQDIAVYTKSCQISLLSMKC